MKKRQIHWEDIIGAQHLGPAEISVDWKSCFDLHGIDERSIGFGPVLNSGEEGILVQSIRLPCQSGFDDIGYVVIDIRGGENHIVGIRSNGECHANVWDEFNSLGGNGWERGLSQKEC